MQTTLPLEGHGSHVEVTNRYAAVVVVAIFFTWGFMTCLNDIVSPYLQLIFHLSYLKAAFVQSAYFITFAGLAIPLGVLTERVGFKATLAGGLLIMSVGALIFVPAAAKVSFTLFLVALATLASGVTALQVAANPYLALLGPSATSSSRLNLAQGFNSLGTTLAPLLGSWLILSVIPKQPDPIPLISGAAQHAYRLQLASAIKTPYLLFALVLAGMSVIVILGKLPRVNMCDTSATFICSGGEPIMRQRHLVLGAVAIFLYVGAEVAIGNFLARYLSDTAIGGFTLVTSAKLVALYWAGAMIGRFAGVIVLRKTSPSTLLTAAAICAFTLTMLSTFSFGMLAVITIIAVGLFNSVMFPTIFSLAIADLGSLTGRASGLLVSAIVGGAVVPLLTGAAADRFGIHRALCIPALSYLFVIYYGHAGSIPRRWNRYR